MSAISLWNPRGLLAGLGCLVAVVVAGCAAPQATVLTGSALPFDDAVAQATDGLVAQTQKLPAFLAAVESKLVKRGVVLDPMIDAGSGEQTARDAAARAARHRAHDARSSNRSRSCPSPAPTSPRRSTC